MVVVASMLIPPANLESVGTCNVGTAVRLSAEVADRG